MLLPSPSHTHTHPPSDGLNLYTATGKKKKKKKGGEEEEIPDLAEKT